MGGTAQTGSMPTRAGARPREAQVRMSGSIPPHALTRPLQGLLAQSRWCERQMKPQIPGPPLVLSVLCLSFVEIKMGSYVAQVSLYIYYVAEGDLHLCPDP